MAKNKETVPEILDEEIREEEQPVVKGPLRDDPEPAYTPAWQVVNRRQDVYSDKFPPKIYSLEALLAAGIVTQEMLADGGYVKNTDYAGTNSGGVIKVNAPTYGTAVGSTGLLQCAVKDASNYDAANAACFMSKGSIENMKTDITARALVDIATAQITTPVAGTYTVKLTYDGAAWGVTIIKDT